MLLSFVLVFVFILLLIFIIFLIIFFNFFDYIFLDLKKIIASSTGSQLGYIYFFLCYSVFNGILLFTFYILYILCALNNIYYEYHDHSIHY